MLTHEEAQAEVSRVSREVDTMCKRLQEAHPHPGEGMVAMAAELSAFAAQLADKMRLFEKGPTAEGAVELQLQLLRCGRLARIISLSAQMGVVSVGNVINGGAVVNAIGGSS